MFLPFYSLVQVFDMFSVFYLNDGVWSTSLLVDIEKKIFCFGFEVFWGNVTSRGVFVLFWPSLPGRGHCPNGPFFGLKVELKTRSKSACIEPLIDFLVYRERKLWLINVKLSKNLLPQKPL